MDENCSFKAGMQTAFGFMKMAYRKLKSFCYITKAYDKFPVRFAKPDNYAAKEYRHYNIKNDY